MAIEGPLDSYDFDELQGGLNDANGHTTGADHRDPMGERVQERGLAGQNHGAANRNAKRKGRRKSESIVGSLCQLIVKHQIGLTVNLLTLLAMTHAFPRARHYTRKFYRLSYYDQSSEKYALGWDDSFLVMYWVVVFCGLRAVVMDYVLTPLAQLVGLEKKKEKTRFAEQAWVLIYDSVFWSLGMYIMYSSKYWLDTRQLWANWPDREMDGLFKWYYLVQFAFWIQQIIVVNIEERRKDHWQMFTHHIITCILMFTSYGYHQTKVGNTILCLMDVVDILLPLAKLLKYLRFKRACDYAFGAFMLIWVGARHVLYLMICYSLYAEIPQEITYGCYRGSNGNLEGPFDVPNDFDHLLQPFRDPEGLVCWNDNIKWAFLGTLLALQVLLLMWFCLIVQVALRVLKGGEAEDSRSDDEGSDGESETEGKGRWENIKTCMEARPIEVPPLEEEVGVESINLLSQKASPSRKYRKMGSTASGVHLPSDRKELLGRIGCDKGT
ncbi:MAG: hypothetical protein LQ343_004919 [Gyalolechia ehrenbergii]|nr:MAG: hypothetical protein LQ343_004919 [Gyalolechia ehrenbergii]